LIFLNSQTVYWQTVRTFNPLVSLMNKKFAGLQRKEIKELLWFPVIISSDW
jgi:hypothetical protein